MVLINIETCHIVSYSGSLSSIEFGCTIDVFILARWTLVKELGNIFSNVWKFYFHIQSICNRATKMLGFVRNSSAFESIVIVHLLYISLVRSLLKIGLSICSLSQTKYSLMKKSVQRKFLCLLSICYSLSVTHIYIWVNSQWTLWVSTI